MSEFINAVDKVHKLLTTSDEVLSVFTKMTEDKLVKFKGSLNDVMKANTILQLKKEGVICSTTYGKTYSKIRKIITECKSIEVENEYSDNKSR